MQAFPEVYAIPLIVPIGAWREASAAWAGWPRIQPEAAHRPRRGARADAADLGSARATSSPVAIGAPGAPTAAPASAPVSPAAPSPLRCRHRRLPQRPGLASSRRTRSARPASATGSGMASSAGAGDKKKAAEPSAAAAAAAAAAREQQRSRRRRRAGMRGYAHEFMEMNINVDPDWDGPHGGLTATSDHGAGPLGFAGTVAPEGLAATGLATLADDEFGSGADNADGAGHLEQTRRRGGRRRRTRLMRQRSPGVNAELSLAWLLEPLSVETFLDEVWAKNHHHIQRDRPEYFDALLPGPRQSTNSWTALRHDPSALRLVRGEDKKGPDSYRLADGSLDIAGVRNDFADGYTIVVDGIEQYVRTVGTAGPFARGRAELSDAGERVCHATGIHRTRPALRRSRRPDPADSRVQDLASVRRRRPAAARDPARSRQSRCARRSAGANGCAAGSRRRAVRAARPRARSRDALRAVHPSDRRNSRAHRAHACHRSAVLAELPR